MAQRVEVVDVECPASTAQASPIEVATTFDAGTVDKLTVVIPDGHAGLTGIALAIAHQPVIPFNRRTEPTAPWRFIEGNDEAVPLALENYPDSGAWSAWLYNTDVVPHTWQLRFEISELVRPAAAGTTPPAPVALTDTGEAGGGVQGGQAGEGQPPGVPEPPPPGEPPPPAAPPEPEAPAPTPAPPPEAEGAPGVPEPAPPPEPEGLPGAPEEAAPPEPEGLPGEPGPGGAPRAAPKRVVGAPRRGPVRKPSTVVRVSHETRPAGGWLQHGARFDRRQLDQGQDFITNWRGWLIAPGAGHVVRILSDRPFPAGFGPHYAVVHIDTGRWAGGDYYLGHTTAHVHAGEHFTEGHHLATADQGLREGGGWVELGPAPNGYPGPMGGGAQIAHLFGPLLITRRSVVHVTTPKRSAPAHGPPAHGHVRPPAPRKAPVRVEHRAPEHPHGPPPRRAPEPPHAAPRPAYHPPPPAPAYHPPPPRPAYHPPPPPPRRAPAPARRR